MGQIILHPEHPDYCKECMYYDKDKGGCKSQGYQEHMFKKIISHVDVRVKHAEDPNRRK